MNDTRRLCMEKPSLKRRSIFSLFLWLSGHESICGLSPELECYITEIVHAWMVNNPAHEASVAREVGQAVGKFYFWQ